MIDSIREEFYSSINNCKRQHKIIVDLKKDVSEDIMKIEGMIDGVKKKIMLA
jgi:hypothetical protein